MKHLEEEQSYFTNLKKAFKEQKDVPYRKLTMTPERYLRLSYTYQKITDVDELNDFAFISTHDDVRNYYISHNVGIVIAEKLSRNRNRNFKHLLDEPIIEDCIKTDTDDSDMGKRFATDTKISNTIDVNLVNNNRFYTIKIELSPNGMRQLTTLLSIFSAILLAFSIISTILIMVLKNP